MPLYGAITFLEGNYILFEVEYSRFPDFPVQVILKRIVLDEENSRELEFKESANNKFLLWRYDDEDNDDFSEELHLDLQDEIVELPDDKSALVWFKLNY